jgi:peptidoglycan hydrolase-like protein with peptidoglycan-binding domain
LKHYQVQYCEALPILLLPINQQTGQWYDEGDTSESVRLVQSLLQAKGCDLEVDGFFGLDTEAAVKDFQGAANLSVMVL